MKDPKVIFDAVEFLLKASKNGRGPAHQAQADEHLTAISELKAEVLADLERVPGLAPGALHAVEGAAEGAGEAVLKIATSGLGAFQEPS